MFGSVRHSYPYETPLVNDFGYFVWGTFYVNYYILPKEDFDGLAFANDVNEFKLCVAGG